MEQNLESKLNFKQKLISLHNHHKLKLYTVIIIVILAMSSSVFFKFHNEKKNSLIAEKYIKAGLYVASNENDNAKQLFDEIILSKNEFYSVLALNTLVEKKIITNKNEILRYFEIIEKFNMTQENTDLIILKKALYLIKSSELKSGNKLLQSLVEKNSTLKKIAEELIVK